MQLASHSARSILIINPNTTQSMTDALRPLVDKLGFTQTRFEYFTAPTGVSSINNEDDAAVSADACIAAFQQQLAWFQNFDGFLVCCYSQHPLVDRIRDLTQGWASDGRRRAVTGIFEASVAVCLQSLRPADRFGIVSTGKQWEDILDDAVASMLGSAESKRYAGTETTGLSATELHTTPVDEVNRRMRAATRRVLQKGARAVCLGCAGMAGMDETVRQACIDELGSDEGARVKIVDGVISGVVYLEGALRAGL